MISTLLLVALSLLRPEGEASDHDLRVRGVTVSCQTWGVEWGTDGFGEELDDLLGLGANWVAIHPYAWIRDDGSVRWREIDPHDPPAWIARPIEEAHRRGMKILVKPHLGYWGSGFAWRGEIAFDDPAARARFFDGYSRWIETVAAASRGADAFCVATELEGLAGAEDSWRGIVARVRARYDGPLTWAANWDSVERVGFWDALDCVGVQGYFPLSAAPDPGEEELLRGWDEVLGVLRSLHERTGKPVVFTEIGYSATPLAAREPWNGRLPPGADARGAEALQTRCLRAAFEVVERERDWLRGCFLWKWFVGEADGRDFVLDTPAVREEIARAWRRSEPASSATHSGR